MSVTHDKHWGKLLFDAGQRESFTHARRYERRKSRRIARSYCKRVARAVSADAHDPLDDIQPPDPVRREWREQGDYLAPLYRFLDSRVGHSWNDTYSILASRTNRSSTVGDHVWLHLWQYVERACHKIEKRLEQPSWRWSGLYIDAAGFLQRFDARPSRVENRWMQEKHDRERAGAAFGSTKIVLCGGVPHLGSLVRTCPLSGRATYRQGRPLPANLRKLFASLTPSVRREWTYVPLGHGATACQRR
jgi:hypothetical protein